MHFSLSSLTGTFAVLSLITHVSATCTLWRDSSLRRECEWYGTSPSCGTSSYSINERDEQGLILKATTEWDSAYTLRESGDISCDCWEDYGAGCLSGYKRLWCGDWRSY